MEEHPSTKAKRISQLCDVWSPATAEVNLADDLERARRIANLRARASMRLGIFDDSRAKLEPNEKRPGESRRLKLKRRKKKRPLKRKRGK